MLSGLVSDYRHMTQNSSSNFLLQHATSELHLRLDTRWLTIILVTQIQVREGFKNMGSPPPPLQKSGINTLFSFLYGFLKVF